MATQTVAALIEELKKLPPDNIIDIVIGHTFQFKHFAPPVEQTLPPMEAKSE